MKEDNKVMSATVSVICLAYNHEKYIRKTLEGFVKQKTNFSVEYIIHDDASTDSTASIVREFEEKYPDLIKPIYQKENQYSKGVPITRNLQMQMQGKYIAFCEGDDYWIDEYKLQKQVAFMEQHPECTLTIHNGFRLNDRTGQFKPLNPYKAKGFLSMREVLVESGGMTPTASMVIKTDVLKKMPVDVFKVPGVGDRPRRLYLATQGSVYYFDDIMCVYRTDNMNSFGGTIMRNNEKSKKLLDNMLSFFDRFDKYTDFKYTDAIELAKSKERYLYYVREKMYSEATKTHYYRETTTKKERIKDFIKWRTPKPVLDKSNLCIDKIK